jgi:hypothetical protein
MTINAVIAVLCVLVFLSTFAAFIYIDVKMLHRENRKHR